MLQSPLKSTSAESDDRALNKATVLNGADNLSGSTWRAGFLGLQFHDGSRRVGRQGFESLVDLAEHNLLWHLLRQLDANSPNLMSYEALLPIWAKYGQEDRPSRETVTDALSRLSKKLIALHIKAKACKNVGWRLVDSSASTHSRPAPVQAIQMRERAGVRKGG